jgi:hypothetical protein
VKFERQLKTRRWRPPAVLLLCLHLVLAWAMASGGASEAVASTGFTQPVLVEEPLRYGTTRPLNKLHAPIPPHEGETPPLIAHGAPPPATAGGRRRRAGLSGPSNAEQSKLVGAAASPQPSTTFDGQDADGFVPPDPSGAAGPNQYVEVVNSIISVYSKTGTRLNGFVGTNSLWWELHGPCGEHSVSDGTVQFDTQSQRWVVQGFVEISRYSYDVCIAVSSSNNATGTWHSYEYSSSFMPDYPKLGIWQDAYYGAYSLYQKFIGESQAGVLYCAYDRTAMLNGVLAKSQCFQGNENGVQAMLPASLAGSTPPPAGEPEWYVGLSPDFFDRNNALIYYKFHVDWVTPANSYISAAGKVTVQHFSPTCIMSSCVPQPETSSQLDAIGDRLMFPLMYRNLGDHESLVVTHSVYSVNGQPDNAYRWMGSMGVDRYGNMLLGYSISSPTLHPGIRYTTRLASDPLNNMPGGEQVLYDGAGSQFLVGNEESPKDPETVHRWGDYTQVSIDPYDDCTFWYVNEYHPSNGLRNWHTKIGSIRLGNCDNTIALTDPATSVTTSAAVLNGHINPNGLPTTFHFEYGPTTSYGSRAPVPDGNVGSGTSLVTLSTAVSGLQNGTTYHFRVVAVTSSKTVYGEDRTFTTPS